MSKMGQDIIAGLNEVQEHLQGKTKLRTTKVIVPDVKKFTPDEIRDLRRQLGYSQVIFANVLGVSNRTVEDWESGKNTPCGSSSRLLEVLQKAPDTIQRVGLTANA